jgi:formyltetrahydrofolate-dependent phosphoribosylglycinamide formyltransferase
VAKKLNIGVLLSGGGRTLENLIKSIEGGLPARIGLVVSSDPAAYGLERAANATIPAEVVDRKNFATVEAFSDALVEALDRHAVDLVVMAGFLHLWRIPERYIGKVLNIHPSLLPRHGGKGMYMDRVHRAVLDAGDTFSGCTVHFADNEYDSGPILLQRQIPVLAGDTPATLANRVFLEECRAYPEAIRLIAAGRVTLESGQARIDGKPAIEKEES